MSIVPKLLVLSGTLVAWIAGINIRLDQVYGLHAQTWTSYTVQPGDTLWGIAERFDPQADPMAVEFWVEQHDGLTEQQQLQPGEQIDVPIGG